MLTWSTWHKHSASGQLKRPVCVQLLSCENIIFFLFWMWEFTLKFKDESCSELHASTYSGFSGVSATFVIVVESEKDDPSSDWLQVLGAVEYELLSSNVSLGLAVWTSIRVFSIPRD